MHTFNSMKVARKRQTLGQLNIAFHSHVSVGDVHIIKGTTFLWEANEEGDKFRQCHISATSETSLLPWPSGSHRSVSSKTCDWSFKNKTQSQSPHFSGRVHTEDMVTSCPLYSFLWIDGKGETRSAFSTSRTLGYQQE